MPTLIRMPFVLSGAELKRAVDGFVITSQDFVRRDGGEVTINHGDTFTHHTGAGDTSWEIQGLGCDIEGGLLGAGSGWLVLASCRENGVQSQYVDGEVVTVQVMEGDHLIWCADSVVGLLDPKEVAA